MTLVDTSALIDYLNDRGLAGSVEDLLGEGGVAVSAITVFELLTGVKDGGHLHSRREILSLTEVIPLTAEIAERSAELFTTLRVSGTTIPGLELAQGARLAALPEPGLHDRAQVRALAARGPRRPRAAPPRSTPGPAGAQASLALSIGGVKGEAVVDHRSAPPS